MKIGLVSYEFKNGKIEYNIKKIKKAIISANGKADLLCFGETFCKDLTLFLGIMKQTKT